MKIILEGKALWSYKEELYDAGLGQEVVALFSFAQPLHHHIGEIALTDKEIIIDGDVALTIDLGQLQQIYMGFDDIFKPTYVKNNGLFWQPLRLTFNASHSQETIYLIIDHNFIGSKNKYWYDALTELFSE